MLRSSLIPALWVFAVSSCSHAVDDGWLVAAPGDTLTVDEASVMWGQLSPEETEFFMAAGVPSSEFVRSIAGRMALEIHIDSSGILADTLLETFAQGWFRMGSAALARQLRAGIETARVDSSDIAFFRENQGRLVWFTAEYLGSMGPFQAADLPRELALLLDRLEQGQADTLPGFGEVRLDSLFDNMPLSGPPTEPDSAVAELIGYGRERFIYLCAYREIRNDPFTFVSPFLSDPTEQPPEPDAVVLSFSLGEWTLAQWERELAFLRYVDPYVGPEPLWADLLVENLLMQTFYRDILEVNEPERADSLRAEIGHQRRAFARDILIRRHLDDAVEVTVLNVLAEYLHNPAAVRPASTDADPSDPAGLEGMREALAIGARFRLEARETGSWLDELADSCGVRVNDDLLSILPPDPGSWR